MEDKAARFTILIDANDKKAFEQLCASQDVNTSQMVRQLIRHYLEAHNVDFTPTPKARRGASAKRKSG